MTKKSSTSKQKVLIFLYNSNKIGGPNTSMNLLMQSWLDKQYDFYVINFNEKLGKLLRLTVINRLRKKIREIDPDIIHITGLQLHGFYASLATRLAGYKNILLVVRGSSTDMISFPKFSKWLFAKIIEPITLKMAKVTYTVCNEMAEKTMIKKNVKFFGGVVHNAAPIYDEKFLNNTELRDELKLSENKIIIVYTGRITKEKGLHFALEAFVKINLNNLVFVICGEGPDSLEFQEKFQSQSTSNKIIFLGARKDIPNILYCADIFLFPSLHENLSNSLLEACSAGLPIIATNVGGNPEVVINNVNGLIVPPNNVDSIINALYKLATNTEMRINMGESSRKIAQQKFSQNYIYSQVDNLYKLTSQKKLIGSDNRVGK